jgi:hypothetical protein
VFVGRRVAVLVGRAVAVLVGRAVAVLVGAGIGVLVGPGIGVLVGAAIAVLVGATVLVGVLAWVGPTVGVNSGGLISTGMPPMRNGGKDVAMALNELPIVGPKSMSVAVEKMPTRTKPRVNSIIAWPVCRLEEMVIIVIPPFSCCFHEAEICASG